MTEEGICPFRKINDLNYPKNTCVAEGTYCLHPTAYQECDIFKRHTRLVDTIENLLGNKDEEN